MSETGTDQEIKEKFGKAEQKHSFVTDLAPLPSNGRVYSKESSLHKKNQIEVKVMSAKEEDILNNRANLRQGTAIDKLLKEVIVDKKINADDLLVGDKNSILLFVRLTGYGHEYPVDMKCDFCGKTIKPTIDLSKIKMKLLDVEPDIEGTNRFSFTLPRSKKVVKFHLLTARNDAEIDKVEENQKKSKLEATPITTKMYYQIDEIEGIEDKDRMAFIKEMLAIDSKAFRDYIDKINPEPIMRASVTCNYCDETFETIVPINLSFFWPRGA